MVRPVRSTVRSGAPGSSTTRASTAGGRPPAVTAKACDALAEHFARDKPIATDLWAGDKTADYPEWFLKPYMVTKENAPQQPGVYHDPPYDFVTYFTTKWGKEFGGT